MSRRKKQIPPPPPEYITLTLTGMDRDGLATGMYEGDCVHVLYGLPGERVEVEIWERREGHRRGHTVRVVDPAPERIEPRCPYFGLCGGCQWQHVPYEQQLRYKRQRVVAYLVDEGGFADPPVRPTLPAPEIYGYRNHARFSIGRRYGELGYTTHHRHRFLRVDRCPIAHPRINEILATTQRRAHGHQLAVRVGVHTGDVLVQPAQDDPDLPYPSGQLTLEEELLGRRYRISGPAFFQVNTLQAERLIETVRAALDPRPDDVLLDLYCGVGTFGLALAQDVRSVIGVEESAAALKDACHNAQGSGNITFLSGRTEEILADLSGQADLAIVDPPRVGCRPDALTALLRLGPRKLAYVSCEPSTLARDLRVLVDGGFVLHSVQPVDMFPQTTHVEAVALLVHP